MKRSRSAIAGAIIVAFLFAVATADASTYAGPTTTSAKSDLVSVNVGVIPISAVAPIYLGIEKGFFSQEGLDVHPQIVQGGTAVIPAVLNGSYQFGFSGVTPLLLASLHGLKLTIVSDANEGGDTDGILVAKNSAIQKPADLAGKTIAINTLGSEGDVTIRRAALKAGVNPATFKWVEIPFPDMLAALNQGRVDAIWQPEPFLTIATAAGARVILRPYGVDPTRTTSVYFTSNALYTKNPSLVSRFTRAMNKSLAYASAHDDEVRASLTTYLKMDPGLAQKIQLPIFASSLNVPSIELTAKLMKAYGLADQIPQIAPLLPRTKVLVAKLRRSGKHRSVTTEVVGIKATVKISVVMLSGKGRQLRAVRLSIPANKLVTIRSLVIPKATRRIRILPAG